jgi:hypothetical protein
MVRLTCPACRGYNHTLLFNHRIVLPDTCNLSGYLDVLRCDSCGMVYYETQNSEEEYTRYYRTIHRVETDTDDAYMWDASYCIKKFKLSPQSLILDYGAGRGKLAEAFESLGIPGIDNYEIGGEIYKRHYDLIVLRGVIEHLPHPLEVLEQLRKYSTKLYVVAPVYHDDQNIFAYTLEHINHFGGPQLRLCLENAKWNTDDTSIHGDQFRLITSHPEPYYVWGAGNKTGILLGNGKMVPDDVIAFIDGTIEGNLSGKPIVTPYDFTVDYIANHIQQAGVMINVNRKSVYRDIQDALKRNGIPEVKPIAMKEYWAKM